MSYIVPDRNLTIEQKRDIRQHTHEAMIKMAMKDFHRYRETLCIRELLPGDLFLHSWIVPKVTDIWSPWVQVNINSTAVIAICSILNLSSDPHILDLKIITNGTVIGLHNLMTCYAGMPTIKALEKALLDPTAREILDRMSPESAANLHVGMPSEGYFSEPYIFHDAQRCEIFTSGIPFKGPENLVLGGFVVEPRGQTIQ
jgi:hypothetical protein